MDILSLVGVFLALVALIVRQHPEGRRRVLAAHPAAFMIVVVGTIAAILLQTPLRSSCAR